MRFLHGEKFAYSITCEVSIKMVYLELTLHKRLSKLKTARTYEFSKRPILFVRPVTITN